MPITKKQWVAALRSGQYTQGAGKYKQPLTTSPTGFAHCCIGVYLEMDDQGLLNEVDKEASEKTSPTAYEKVSQMLENRFDLDISQLIDLNDYYGCTFDQIANAIEAGKVNSLWNRCKADRDIEYDGAE